MTTISAGPAAALLAVARAAMAEEILTLAEDVAAGLNDEGPSAAIPASQQGMVTLMAPPVIHAAGKTNDEGITLPDFGAFEGRLVESWTFDPATLTRIVTLREGVKGCNGATFDADDVVHTFERATSVSDAAPIGWFPANVGTIRGCGVGPFGDDSGGEGTRRCRGEARRRHARDPSVGAQRAVPSGADDLRAPHLRLGDDGGQRHRQRPLVARRR